MSESKKILRKLEGTVVSIKMDKTTVVKVDRQVINKKYQKRHTVSKRYKCHDPKNQYQLDDKVVIAECRPYSKEKRWRVVKKID